MGVDYHHELLEQLRWHWSNQLRPRLDGLTDDEYLWEPVDDCWSIRPREGGGFSCDWAPTEPSPALVLHINREVIHHGAEMATLRDLYRASNAARLS